MVESEQATRDDDGCGGQPCDGETVVLVGLMGAGKTSIGRRLAMRLAVPFVDADEAIAEAAGCSIEEIFERFGEAEFRDGEQRVIARLLDGPPVVLATGGGAFMDPQTRRRIAAAGISVWLRADLDTLVRRTARRHDRPLLKNADHRQTLKQLMAKRYPVYEQADIIVDSLDGPPEETVARVLDALAAYRAARKS